MPKKMEDAKQVKSVWKRILYGKRRRGQPRKRQMNDIIRVLVFTGTRFRKGLANDRGEWRRTVAEVKTHQGL